MSIITTHGRSTKTRTKRQPSRNKTYYAHECPICHELYTNTRPTARSTCGQTACQRLWKLEQQKEAANVHPTAPSSAD